MFVISVELVGGGCNQNSFHLIERLSLSPDFVELFEQPYGHDNFYPTNSLEQDIFVWHPWTMLERQLRFCCIPSDVCVVGSELAGCPLISQIFTAVSTLTQLVWVPAHSSQSLIKFDSRLMSRAKSWCWQNAHSYREFGLKFKGKVIWRENGVRFQICIYEPIWSEKHGIFLKWSTNTDFGGYAFSQWPFDLDFFISSKNSWKFWIIDTARDSVS